MTTPAERSIVEDAIRDCTHSSDGICGECALIALARAVQIARIKVTIYRNSEAALLKRRSKQTAAIAQAVQEEREQLLKFARKQQDEYTGTTNQAAWSAWQRVIDALRRAPAGDAGQEGGGG